MLSRYIRRSVAACAMWAEIDDGVHDLHGANSLNDDGEVLGTR